ncbi:helix-turn-helix domain-containing protein [Parasphingopyxis algicola]|uniref:helix-turn-helix transcriptional regulator n=1 Tax=Parasphingopyxis algicola TaxID=2026624 RepID=UPI0015A1581A|nr:helix-turn-helix domain-containing protein [Parasphingopyxis algicola]QLC24918.1 helix-turn-helix domain-containing protein [Parasphingopyxis algicola]
MTQWPLDWTALVDEAIRRRKSEGLTQATLGELAGVSTPTVNAFERGEINLRLETVASILGVLGMFERPGPPDSFGMFRHQSRRRWNELTEPLPQHHPARQPLGYVEHSYSLDCEIEGLTLSGLRRVLSRMPKTSGWTPFWVPTREDLKPAIRDGSVECWLGKPDVERFHEDAAHSDFWQVTPDIYAYLRRGYQEDGESNLDPGTIFDVTLPIWRTAEVLLHAANLAARIDAKPNDTIQYAARYTGLEGRDLLAWASPRLIFEPGRPLRAQSTKADISVRTSSEEVQDALEQVIARCLPPLYERFDGYEAPQSLIVNQVAEFQQSVLQFSVR